MSTRSIHVRLLARRCIGVLFLLCAAMPALAGHAADSLRQPGPPQPDLVRRLQAMSPLQADEVLWLARCLYTESDVPHEQELVAWVVRNRVETAYRGRTYREVVLDPYQFSAFNQDTQRRRHVLQLSFEHGMPAWRRTLAVALKVYEAPASARPFTVTTRHFYSPISMPGHAAPVWARDRSPISLEQHGVDPFRFQFFDNLEGFEPPDNHFISRAPNETDDTGAHESAGASTTSPQSRLRPGRSQVARPARPQVTRPGRTL